MAVRPLGSPSLQDFAIGFRIMRVLEGDKDLSRFWLFALAGMLNSVVASQRVVLGLYTMPTVVSAYLYGRRHATLTALASVLLVILLSWFNPEIFGGQRLAAVGAWLDVTIWGGTLIVTGYLMGTLCDHRASQVRELRETYDGVLLILRHFISKDQYTENHSYRVSIYASRIAEALHFTPDRIEDVRSAALLHDIGKLDVSRESSTSGTAHSGRVRRNQDARGSRSPYWNRWAARSGGSFRSSSRTMTNSTAGVHSTQGATFRSIRASSPSLMCTTRSRATAVSQGDVALRGARDDRERFRDRVRPGHRRGVFSPCFAAARWNCRTSPSEGFWLLETARGVLADSRS